MSGACEMGTHPLESALHPLVDCALTSVSATLRRDTRGAKGRVKERNEGLDSGIMARGMESHAVRALDEMPVARASESVAQGLGNGGAGGAAGDVALALRGRSEEEIEGEGDWEVLGVLDRFWKAKRGVSQASLERGWGGAEATRRDPGQRCRREGGLGPWP